MAATMQRNPIMTTKANAAAIPITTFSIRSSIGDNPHRNVSQNGGVFAHILYEGNTAGITYLGHSIDLTVSTLSVIFVLWIKDNDIRNPIRVSFFYFRGGLTGLISNDTLRRVITNRDTARRYFSVEPFVVF